MGDHPIVVSNTAPYPTQDIGPSESSSSNPPSMTEVTSGLEDLHLPPNQNKNYGSGNIVNQSVNMPPQQPPGSNMQLQSISPRDQAQFNQQNIQLQRPISPRPPNQRLNNLLSSQRLFQQIQQQQQQQQHKINNNSRHL